MVGGAGDIGAHVVESLAGHLPVVVDDLSTGSAQRIPWVELVVADVAAPESLASLMRDRRVDAVIHLAARKRVDESVARPLYYLPANVAG